jgi:adhesin transport system membrane fusion protein
VSEGAAVNEGLWDEAAIDRLENFHRRDHSVALGILVVGLLVLGLWAAVFRIDQVARATGEVIASSRVQIIQAVDGGVLEALYVKEGDRVERGQQLALLDTTRVGAAVKEIEARVSALRAKTIRLRAEVTGKKSLAFPAELEAFPDLVQVETALFEQRRRGLVEELRTLEVASRLAREEVEMVEALARAGDVSRTEVIRAERSLNEAEAERINRRNQFLEAARGELAQAEDEIAQNLQILTQRQQQVEDSVFVASVPGIVKNVRVTTVGGVLRAGEELMQIVPIGDDLIVEAKVKPADIAQVRSDLEASIRFDPYDYTLYGAVIGKVLYVSADTLKEEASGGEEIYYRVHVSPNTNPVQTTSGKSLDILPGMTAQVDIRTGDRTVMSYLLKPLRRTASEAFGER